MKTSSAVAQHSKINVVLTGCLAQKAQHSKINVTLMGCPEQNRRSGIAAYSLGIQDREPYITL